MNEAEFKDLSDGDIVQAKIDGQAYVVTGNYGSRVTAVRSVDITNPDEWDLISKSVLFISEKELDKVLERCPSCKWFGGAHASNCHQRKSG